MQFQLLLARAAAEQAKIVSGAYKLDKTRRSTGLNPDGSIAWRDSSEGEKMENAIATMERHLKLAQECLDAFGQSMEKRK